MISLHTNINRRQLLSAGALVVLGPDVRFSTHRADRGEDLAEALSESFLRIAPDRSWPTTIGVHYLRLYPEQHRSVILSELVTLEPVIEPGAAEPLDSTDVQERILAQFRKDFSAGRVVDIEGWILSKTECQLCALIALTR